MPVLLLSYCTTIKEYLEAIICVFSGSKEDLEDNTAKSYHIINLWPENEEKNIQIFRRFMNE